ncbi:MAG: 2OG-Fe(II) oxygenase [Planctomycetes bacterium]|nr:2OG-Fe(II) oxygenase [Planctomycetota bacterium]
MSAFTVQPNAFEAAYLRTLRKQIHSSRFFTVNTLNRDFVGTRGFSIVFRRETVARVAREFPYFARYLDVALTPDCNAFYLNPLHLVGGSRVDPHIDRSLRSYCAEVAPPVLVSVLYVEVPPAMRGGDLVLSRGKKHLGRVTPSENTIVRFDGDLTHSVERVETDGSRLSLVCEQYRLTPDELDKVPEFTIETRAKAYGSDTDSRKRR